MGRKKAHVQTNHLYTQGGVKQKECGKQPTGMKAPRLLAYPTFKPVIGHLAPGSLLTVIQEELLKSTPSILKYHTCF